MAGVFAVIMAGSRGRWLWLLRTQRRSGQFLLLLSGKSFLQDTILKQG
jgi:mannose-1-phosphate guanylyltransferase